MVGLSKWVVAGGILAMSCAIARAADMPGYPPSLPEPGYKPPLLDLNSGWYLRGDLGAAWGRLDRADAVAPMVAPTDNRLGNGMIGGAGIGIKTGWLRTDVTIDYTAPLKYQGTIATAGDTTAKIQPTTALFNGYFDLGTWYRLTPYIGGGVGVSYTRVSDLASTAVALSGDTAKNQWHFTWAGMAGVAYPISRNMLMDVSYRYLNLGDVSTASNPTGSLVFKNVAAHEVRVGVRWSFDDLRYGH